MKIHRITIVMMFCMAISAALAVALRPTHKIADAAPAISLEAMVPKTFGDWHEDERSNSLVVDPEQSAMIKKIYSQTLSRTYINASGYRVMLSLAYGRDQSDGLQLHKPEICYPAQGFQVQNKWDEELQLPGRNIPIRRILTTYGSSHKEPVSYWTLIGKTVAIGETSKKIAQLQYSMKGQIPDGLLFRVSSIDSDSKAAFEIQNSFINSLLASVTPSTREQLSGK